MPATSNRLFDLSAIGLSGLCLAHCLILPLAAVALPALGAWSRAEWVHGLFVAIAAPLTGFALWRVHLSHPLPGAMIALAMAGLALLLIGALPWPAAAWETPLTVVGSLCLAATHLWNWRRHQRLHAAKPEIAEAA